MNQHQIGYKIEFVVFCRSNIKIEIQILQDNPREILKCWIPIYTLTHQNFAQKFLRYAHFSSFSSQFPKISNFPRAINFCRTETLSI